LSNEKGCLGWLILNRACLLADEIYFKCVGGKKTAANAALHTAAVPSAMEPEYFGRPKGINVKLSLFCFHDIDLFRGQ